MLSGKTLYGNPYSRLTTGITVSSLDRASVRLTAELAGIFCGRGLPYPMGL
jgi:hypothetical protein